MTDLLLAPDAQDLLFREARTAHAFTDEPVTREQVAAIYDLVKYGPTAMNGQPLRILLVDAEQREANARFNAALQAGYFLIGVRAAGLAAGPMSGFDAAGVDEEFLAGTSWKSFLVVNLGRPAADAWFDRLPRLGLDEVVAEA